MTGSFSCPGSLWGESSGQTFVATPLVGREGTGVTCVNRLTVGKEVTYQIPCLMSQYFCDKNQKTLRQGQGEVITSNSICGM